MEDPQGDDGGMGQPEDQQLQFGDEGEGQERSSGSHEDSHSSDEGSTRESRSRRRRRRVPLVERLRRLRDQQRAIREQGGHSSWWTTRVPDRPEAIPLDTFTHGPADNPRVFGGVVQTGGILPVMFRTLNIGVFGRASIMGLDVDGFLLASCITSIQMEHAGLRRQQVIAEMIAPYYPENRCLTQTEPEAELARILNQTNVIDDQTWFVETLQDLNRGADPATTSLRELWVIDGRKWKDGTTVEKKLELLQLIAANLPARQKARAMYVIILAILAFALRGEILQAKLNNAQKELAGIMPGGVIDNLSRENISVTWRNFGHLVNDANIGDIFARWLANLPVSAVRLRVIVAQATGSGLTSLDVFARTTHQHLDFPWQMIERLYPDQWRNAVEAVQRVGNNPYYGYRGDLRHVRAARYRNVAWVCGRLLIAAGDTSLADYKGFAEDKAVSEHLERIIAAYLVGQRDVDLFAPPTVEELGRLNSLLELVAQYPANTGLNMDMTGHGHDEYDQDSDSEATGASSTSGQDSRGGEGGGAAP